MDKIEKLLKRTPEKDREKILEAYYKILNHEWEHLDKKKLSGNLGYRVRVGNYRIKFIIDEDGDPAVYDIERRSSNTY